MTTVNKRIVAEIGELFTRFDSVCHIKENNGIKLILSTTNNEYILFFNKEYPFRIPRQINYNGINWKYYLYQDMIPLTHFYLKCYYNCTYYNIIDNDNWSPGIKILNIIDCINDTVKIKNEILYRMLCFKIKYKYGCYHANIESYLFDYKRSMYFK